MKNLTSVLPALIIAATFALCGCGKESSAPESADAHDHGTDSHVHEDADATMSDSGGSSHEGEVALAPMTVGGLTVTLAQEHGELEAGKELHLIVRLPYSDNGATVIRAWLGTEDRFGSIVEKAQYASSPDLYNVHALAPNPLPENTMWWIEIEKPDGEKLLGTAEPR